MTPTRREKILIRLDARTEIQDLGFVLNDKPSPCFFFFLWRVNDDAVLTEIHKQVIKGHKDAQEEQRKQRDTQPPA